MVIKLFLNLSWTINRIDSAGISSEMEQAFLELHGSREGLEVMLDAHALVKKRRKEELEAFQ